MQNREITIYHSPDADDAFMFYGLTCGAVEYPGYTFTHELCDIQTLNERTMRGELDVTAVSVHAFAHLNNQYAILTSGASMGGEDYGPRLVAQADIDLSDGVVRTIAVPGEQTSAALALKIFLKENEIDAKLVNIDFDQVMAAVQQGRVDAGVIIHEGQLTFEREGLVIALDLGKWWWQKTQKPLPLGINVVRKELGDEAIEAAATVLRQSIEYSLEHRDQALDYALSYGRGLSKEEADLFVSMYVNDYTCDLGSVGTESIRQFLALGVEYDFIPKNIEIEFR